MDDDNARLQYILALCSTDEDLDEQIIKHAKIVQNLICRLAHENDQPEERIRAFYSACADMAVAQFDDPNAEIRKLFH